MPLLPASPVTCPALFIAMLIATFLLSPFLGLLFRSLTIMTYAVTTRSLLVPVTGYSSTACCSDGTANLRSVAARLYLYLSIILVGLALAARIALAWTFALRWFFCGFFCFVRWFWNIPAWRSAAWLYAATVHAPGTRAILVRWVLPSLSTFSLFCAAYYRCSLLSPFVVVVLPLYVRGC